MDCVSCEKCRLWGKLQTLGTVSLSVLTVVLVISHDTTELVLFMQFMSYINRLFSSCPWALSELLCENVYDLSVSISIIFDIHVP